LTRIAQVYPALRAVRRALVISAIRRGTGEDAWHCIDSASARAR
jgi:hypothetical protein